MRRAGTISLTQQLAFEFRRPNIGVRVNTLAPGYFPSEVRVRAGLAMVLTKGHLDDASTFLCRKHGGGEGSMGNPRRSTRCVMRHAWFVC